MFTTQLNTANPELLLIKPDVARDAPLSVNWLADPHGRYTLRMMGVSDKDNHASNLDVEIERVEGFLTKNNEYNWAISYQYNIIGAIWVFLDEREGLLAPSLHFMIGEKTARGKGIGTIVARSVVEYLFELGHHQIHSRHLLENHASEHVLSNIGFMRDGIVYVDHDGLHWQNVVLLR